MTNDEIRRNAQIRMTNPPIAHQSALRDLGFGFVSTFVIRQLVRNWFMVPMHGKNGVGALHEPQFQVRMTNDEIRRNTEIRMTKPPIALLSAFGIRASDFFRYLSFVIRYSTGSWSQCMRNSERGLSMNPRVLPALAGRTIGR